MPPLKIIQVSPVYTPTQQINIAKILKANEESNPESRVNFEDADVIVFHMVRGVRTHYLCNSEGETLLPEFTSYRGNVESNSKNIIYLKTSLLGIAGNKKAEKIKWSHNEIMGVRLKLDDQNKHCVLSCLCLEHSSVDPNNAGINYVLDNQLDDTLKKVKTNNVVLFCFIGDVSLGMRGRGDTTVEGLKARLFYDAFCKLDCFVISRQRNDATNNSDLAAVLSNPSFNKEFDPIVETTNLKVGSALVPILTTTLLKASGAEVVR